MASSTMLSTGRTSPAAFMGNSKKLGPVAGRRGGDFLLKEKSFGRARMAVAVNVSHFEGVSMAPPDPILGVSEAFRANTSDMKLNLGVGAYRTEELQPYVLNVVKKAENLMLERGENKEYLPIEGLAAFNTVTAELLFGADSPVIQQGRVATVQSLSGTGSLRLAAAFIQRYFPDAKVLISSPSWGNHKNIFDDAGVRWSEYRYYDPRTVGLDFDGMLEDIEHSSKESLMSIDIYDEFGLGGGASGVSGGLLHPYSPKGKLLWMGSESWRECLKLLEAAETAVGLSYSSKAIHDHSCSFDGPIILRRGILRPATTETNVEILKANAQNCLTSCKQELLDGQAATSLVPNLSVPYDFAIYMPLAMSIHPKRYLQALFLSCKNYAAEASSSACEVTDIKLFREHVNSLRELDGEYDAVIICLGAKAGMLPELSGKLPLRNCRGIIAELELPADLEEYRDQSPSILSDAWLAFQGPRNALVGSTWEWKSDNDSSRVASDEAAAAIGELVRRASAVYPEVMKWEVVGARAGLRAMPPLTPIGSLPLVGCVDGAVV